MKGSTPGLRDGIRPSANPMPMAISSTSLRAPGTRISMRRMPSPPPLRSADPPSEVMLVTIVSGSDVERTTALLSRLAQGDGRAQELFYDAVCAELRSVAAGLMRKQDVGHTLQPTALVHEAWIRMIGNGERSFVNRQHFLCVAGKAMRSVLVDHVRVKNARKRGGDMLRHGLDEAIACLEASDTDLLDLDEALEGLQADDPELARVVELRFFCGLTQPETAAALGVSVSTVERMWRIARARLHRSMGMRHSEEIDDGLG